MDIYDDFEEIQLKKVKKKYNFFTKKILITTKIP